MQRKFGIPAEVDNIRRELHSKGEFTASQWADANINDWIKYGIRKEEILDTIKNNLRLHDNAAAVIHRLKQEGYKLALVSNSLDIALETVFPDHPFDHIFIGNIAFDDEGNISTWAHQVHEKNNKADIIRRLAEEENIDPSRIAFVGDDVNDIEAMQLSGLGIAFNPRSERVKQEANIIIDECDYAHLLQHVLHKV